MGVGQVPGKLSATVKIPGSGKKLGTLNSRTMLSDLAKAIVKKPFHLFGLDLIRRRRQVDLSAERRPLLDQPLDALCYERGGKKAAFRCPLSKHVNRNGLSYSHDGYHPFVETIREYAAGESTCYQDSILKLFYDSHQPDSAAEAVVGFGSTPAAFRDFPPHAFYLTPWCSQSVDEMESMVRRWNNDDYRKHGCDEMSVEQDGFMDQGPISHRKGRLEFERLVTIYESIKRDGYAREHGHAHFLVLRRGDSYRYVSKGQGNHRTAAMSAIGYETIPAVFAKCWMVDIDLVDHWPQVRLGVWTRGQAEAYFDHLFDFDSRDWARERGLLVSGGRGE